MKKGLLIWGIGTGLLLASLVVHGEDAARETTKNDLLKVATDRTAIRSACSQKGPACDSARAQYQIDVTRYHQNKAAARAMRGQSLTPRRTGRR